jgi:DNA-binding NtrC family response regulator
MLNKKILIVDDEELIRITLNNSLKKEGYEVLLASDGEEGFNKFKEEKPPVVLCDLKLPKIDGITLLKKIKEINKETIVIMITAYGTIESAVCAMKLGAYDYITKPFLMEDIIMLIKRAFEIYYLREENKLLREKLKGIGRLEGIIGKSEKMQEVYQIIKTVAKTDATCIIYGETGTGKELVAEAIHNLSLRKDKPLVKVSCAILSESLLEAELFGYEKGAFTGAYTRKLGRFELANKGTIFLDDVDDIKPDLQVKLLRVLQEREFERIGGQETISVDVRVICASKIDLKEMVKEKKFREDLYYRLNVIPIYLPPLRERKEDIPLLLEHFIDKYTKDKKIKFSEDAIEVLMSYHWPGNIRELENVIERIIVLQEKEIVSKEDVSFIKEELIKEGEEKSIDEVLREKEKEYIIKVLEKTGGKKKEAAEILGITYKTLWQKMKEYGIK